MLSDELKLVLTMPARLSFRCCQTNSNESQLGQIFCPLFGAKLAPLGQSGATVQFEILSRIETALRIEEVENRSVD